MIDQPLFWITAIVAVVITGISKGGFGGLALFAVPLMALTISPLQAAGIMLPILIVMDWISVWSYRKHWDKALVFKMVPAAVIGIGIGWALAGYVTDNLVRVIVGMIAVAFPLYHWFGPKSGLAAIKDSRLAGYIAGSLAGFTSFIAHAGGPPFQAYAIPQGLPHRIYAGSAVMFFFVVNAVKLVPYAALGQFDKTNLTTSLILLPLAPIGVLIGVYLVKRIDGTLFYRIMYGLIFITGLKLLFDVFIG
ncbi:sulfite exporter TauE/SafE family protein [Litorimonas sp. RW-G-Af-16]|uniref:sulfite exporter TauE/SafE family protein n=1 Tax=Litorimonas sp. RW-G-Af-16 TaxID=3241168 RepID=UPI00390C643B